MSYQTLKTARSYLHLSGHNTRTWQTDERTDGQMSSLWLLQRYKYGSHSIRLAIAANRMVHAHFTTVCVVDAELLAMEFAHCRDPDLWLHSGVPPREYWMVVDLFCSCDPKLDIMTFIYERDLYSLEINRMHKYQLATSRLSKVTAWQTDRIDQNYKPRRFVGGQ